ncbi:MAG: hypothetical protein A3C64_00455 [Candidatus Yanofskybacteria bacterium RIFCSPHIGHO2_02_FULL_41_12]|nr:MAG: hypothetical protein A3C64_00455 [Candidatus Yanofskybacteria bacterium RIFCSPHIGHO2_02_FULL_41_12]OGN21730.1 MAG: hypothetical protein A3B00_02720 [Candidatus Yanofskybacteria bacterium RIFCSPLOWO2_01_FULL_41_33]
MRTKQIELYKEKLKLSDYQKEVLIGLLLGDGHLETQNNGKTYRLKIEHTYWQKEYTDWLYQIFKDWVLTAPQEKEQAVNDVLYKKYWFSTVSHGAFRFYAQQFYQNKHKILPKLIHKWLSPLAITVWFMDDGSLKSNRHRALIFNTQSFSKTEVLRLSKIMEDKFGIAMALRKQSRKTEELYQLITIKDGAEKLAELIKPYILPSMKYKLGKLG